MIVTGSGDTTPVQAFSFLNAEEKAVLSAVATQVFLGKGEALFHAGDAAEEVFFLEKGRLAVLKETGFNERTQVVALLEPGASVGEGGALGDLLRTATVVAIEESLLYGIKHENMADLGEQDPQMLIRVFKRLLYVSTMRLQKSSERLAHIL
jgi:CRP/FNR family transcriptional regulator, cyclic AMP receptor protein